MTKNEYIVNKICNLLATLIFIVLILLPFGIYTGILCVIDMIVYIISINNIINYEGGDIYTEAE